MHKIQEMKGTGKMKARKRAGEASKEGE